MPDMPPPLVSELQVTAPRLAPSPGDAAFAITTLRIETLATAPRLDEALRSEPGVALFRRTGSEVANPTVQGLSLRAIAPSGAGRTLVTLDGAPQNDPFGGWVIWSALPPEGLAAAQIIKGSGAGPYGAGALTGVVALSERAPARGLSALDVSAGSRGTYRAAAAMGTETLLAVISGSTTEGYTPIRGAGRGQVDQPAGLNQVSAAARLQGEVAGVQTAFRLDAYEERRGGGVQGVNSQASGGAATLSLAQPSQTDAGGWRIQAWLRASDLKNRFAAVEPDRSASRPAARQLATPALGYGANAAWRQVGGAWTWEVGGDVRVADGETREFFRDLGDGFTRGRVAGGRTLVGGVYGETTYEAERLLLTGGLRLDGWSAREARRIERDLNGGAIVLDSRADDASGTTPTGRLGARLALTETLYLRGAAYAGFRPPTLNELHRPFRVGNDLTEANPDLEPERLYGVEAAVGGAGPLRWSAGLFFNRLEDPITNVTIGAGPGTFPIAGFVPAGGVLRQRQNAGAIDALGLEVSAQRTWGSLDLRGAAVATSAEVDGGSAAPQLTGLRPAQTPEFAATVGLDWRASARLRLSAEARHEGQRYEDDLNTRRLGAATTLDLRGAWRLGEAAEAYLAADNVLDADIEAGRAGDGLLTLGAPRTIRVGYSLRR
ncbi:MAG: TonB-dependent receptor [Phenylobacterium sp.]|uniref:TonB-dependent receptor n=1 Tax=Phenylobacterium sp. TaxID=1871053 RepID=UPI002719FF6B|nr:TonB-dependent receptor [Phenylobacterium sp.]MDO8410190.1 TonB-dependent receptor [Phenylobacterium sp.]